MQTITRPTTMGLAFLNAASRSIIAAKVPIDQVPHTPSIPWVARRVAVMQGAIGTVSEPAIKFPKKVITS